MRRALQRHGEPDHKGAPGTGRATAARKARGIGQHRRDRWLAPSGGVLAALLAVAGCGAPIQQAGGHTPVRGGTVTYALNPETVPNYIFPFSSLKYFSVVNSANLQYLLYRPLYWYGEGALPFLNKSLSLAYPPTFQGRVVTIKLKRYRWSNGKPVTARDVVFWINMMKEERQNWGGYVPGGFPDNVQSARAVSQTEVRIVTTGTFSQTWFTDNELSQITPMPQRWDYTASGQSDCTTRIIDCAAVYKYLDSQAQTPAHWPGSPLWGVVDGPWKLTGYNSQGVLTFQINTLYSGPLPRYHITEFQELPFTSEEAEYNVLQAQGRNTLDVGYLPTVDASVPAPGQTVGQNPVSGYQLQPLYVWGLSYFPYNFGPLDPQVAIINQQYFRTAFQSLMNQAAVIQGPLHGYGKPSTSVVGDYPRTKYLSAKARQGDPFPYNPVAAKLALKQHGWHVQAGGTTTCESPGTGAHQCGQGVAKGAQLNFTLDYATGLAWLEAEVLQLKSNALELGIHIDLKGMSFNDVVGRAAGDCGPLHNRPCRWELADWGNGWSYVPDYLPTGDELFGSRSVANLGHYSLKANDILIAATLKSSDISLMWKWEDFLTPQLPVVLQPDAPYQLVESINNLRIGPQSSTLAITPEAWYYVR
jgi:peptide/nickel transport system substrate-binding protein